MSKLRYCTVIGMLFLLVACRNNSMVYNKAFTFKDKVWAQDVKPVFEFEISDTSHFYTMQITIRVTTGYDYSNLWMFVHSKAPNGETGREPYEMKITNPDGSWAGKTSGTIVENSFYFRNRKFPQKGKYRFTFEQGITEKTANNVMDISCSIYREEKQ